MVDRTRLLRLRGNTNNSHVAATLQKSRLDLSSTKELYDKVLDFQDKYKILNYHPYMSLLDHVSKRFGQDDFDLEDGAAWVALYETALEQYSRGGQWCQKHQFMPFFRTPEESESLGSAFIASALARLIDYENLRQKEDAYKRVLVGYRERMRLGAIVQAHRDELKRMQSRNLEHMAIFTAVIAIVIPAASLATRSESAEVAHGVLLDTAMGMVLPLALLFLILESGNWKVNPRWLVSAITLSTMVGLSLLVSLLR